MILKIRKIEANKDQRLERLVLDVVASGNLGNYAIVDSTFNPDGSISNRNRHFYAFPNQVVNKNDVVVLYSGKNHDYVQSNSEDGSKTYFYHWNLDVFVWNENDTAYLLHIVDSKKKDA